jgi:hypothetical protein
MLYSLMGEMRLSFIDSDLLYRGIHYDSIDYKSKHLPKQYADFARVLLAKLYTKKFPVQFIISIDQVLSHSDVKVCMQAG